MAAGSGAQRDEMYGDESSSASEEQLLDVLYEIMAQGVDPSRELSVADVEGFLHAHARQKKPLAELSAFFVRHGLSTDPAVYAADPDLGELASGLHRERGPSSSMFLLDDPRVEEPLPDTPTNRARVAEVSQAAAVPGVEARPQAREQNEDSGVKPRSALATPASSRLRYGFAAVVLVLVGAFAFSMQRGRELERKLTDARLQQRTTDLALSVLERRAEGLSAELNRAEAQRNELSARFESFVSDEARTRAAEGEALKRLLGPRYETLRDKGLAQPAH